MTEMPKGGKAMRPNLGQVGETEKILPARHAQRKKLASISLLLYGNGCPVDGAVLVQARQR